MTQTLQFDEKDWSGASPAKYEMKTSYWNDAPCKSGWMFAACTPSNDLQRQQCSAASHDFGWPKVRAYQTDTQAKANPTCTKGGAMSFCCDSNLGCPKQACPGKVDLNDNCNVAPITCPQWPQCIINGNCKGKPEPCSGLAGEVKDDSCAFHYPGCGAVNDYQNLDYNGADAKRVMDIVATGTARKVLVETGPVADTPSTLSLNEKYDKLCGAKNNLFSYSAAGSADLLAQAAKEVQKYNCDKNIVNTEGAWINRSSCVQGHQGCEIGTAGCLCDVPCSGNCNPKECDVNEWQCDDGHPTWCACSNVVQISLSSLKVTFHDATLMNKAKSSCNCMNGVAQWTENTVDLKGCSTSNCEWLNSIGYNTSAPDTVETQQWYAQYYRPVQSENMLYLGAQQKDLGHALDTPFHAEGVYTLDATCTGCRLQIPLMLATMLTILGFHVVDLH